MFKARVPGVFASLAAAVAISIGGAAAIQAGLAHGAAEPVLTGPVKVAARRVTESQYRHIIADVFGPDIKLNARFEPERREDGLLAVGSVQMSITGSGFEQYFSLAKSVADQALDPKRRDATLGCKPTDEAKPDDACTAAFVRKYGERLFRRPLTEAEVAARIATARKGAEAGGFYKGANMALTSLLAAPEYLFRVEVAEPDKANGGRARLDGYTKASRLSFLIWDNAPDAELMAAAASGAIHTDAGLKQQIDRMVASPRLRDGARAFFTDMLQLDQFDGLTKDAATYPKFSQAVADSAKEETLRSLIEQLVVRRGDYRDIFTTNQTIINRNLAAVYNVPYRSAADWSPYSFDPKSERSGILTQATFLSLFAHPAASSPTKRGVKLHEIFMCQPTPDPPADVDFSKVQAVQNGTVRTRLTAHMTNPGCAVCHKMSDPAGLTLEHFDGLGQLRTTENGAPIDVSADIRGTRLVGAQGLGKFMHDEPRVPVCLVRNVYNYGVGRPYDYKDEVYINGQSKAFADSGYRFASLLTSVASSPEFFKPVLPAAPASAPARVAAASTPAGAVQ